MTDTAVRGARTPLILAATLVLIALNLRFALAGVSPVLDDLRHELGLSSSAAGLLTTAPVLCFGLAAPLGPRLARRVGEEALLLGCMLVLAAGIALRLVPAVAPLFAGTIVLGIAIAVANVVMPSVIKRDFRRPGTMMGLYSMSLSGGAALAAAVSVPLEHALGSWRWALGAGAVFAVLAAAAWVPMVSALNTAEVSASPHVRLWRNRTAWTITATFGLQSMLFYTVLAWVPDILRGEGMSSGTAGFMLSIVMLLGLPSSMLVPIVAARLHDQRPLLAGAVVFWAAGFVGLLLSPASGTLAWMVLLGLAQGAGIALALMLIVVRSPDGAHATAMSGMAQAVGYVVAAAGPLGVGIVHDATGGWEGPIIVLLAVCLGMLACGLAAARPGTVRDDTRPSPITAGD